MPVSGLPRRVARQRRLIVTGFVLAIALTLVASCGNRPTGEPRQRTLVIEGQVRQLVGTGGFRVAPPGSSERGILVLAIDRAQPRRLDRVRVVGLQHTLRLRELEDVLQADLDAYGRYEGEEVLVAEVVEITRRG